MALSMQIGDIAVILNTISWIKQNCFAPSSQASLRYKDLKERIEEFGHALEKLQQIGVHHNHGELHGPLKAPSESSNSLNLKKYQATLEECKYFLQRHAHVEGRVTSPFENGWWAKNQEPEVQALEKKINEHYMSAIFHLGICQLDRHDSVTTRPTTIPNIPPLTSTWRVKFSSSVLVDDSMKLESTEDLPLQESLEALYDHVKKSETPADPFGLAPFGLSPIDNGTFAACYLHLLKAQWLYEATRDSKEFQREHNASQARQYITRIGQEIAERHRAFEIHPSEEALLTQWSKDQSVWLRSVMPPQIRRSSSLLPTQLEKEIIRLELSNQGMYEKNELHITKINDNTLRLKRKKIFNNTNSTDTESSPFRLPEDNLVPWYVLNPKVGLIIQPLVGKGEEFHLKSRTDKLRLQAAFTGYDVCRPRDAFSDVKFSVTIDKGLFSSNKQESGAGEVQLWNSSAKPGPGMDSPTSPPGSFASSTRSNPTIAATTITQGMKSSIFTYQENDTGSSGGVISGKLPPPPLLVALTHDKELYRIWRVDRE